MVFKFPFVAFFFVQHGGKCKECEDGTFSNDSISCRKCPEHMFGRRCKFKCMCLAQERCDPLVGCTNNSKHDVKMESETRSTIIIPSIPDDFKTTHMYYILAAGGVIGWIIFCLSCTKLIYKRRFQVRPTIQNGPPALFSKDTLRSQCWLPLPPIPRTSQHIYDTADEILLSTTPINSLPNENSGSKSVDLPKQCTSNIDLTNIISCSKLYEQEYLKPYTTLKDNSKRVTVLHEYVDCNKSCEERKDFEMSQTKNEERRSEEQTTFMLEATRKESIE